MAKLNEQFLRMQELAGIITEQVEQLQIIDKKSEDGNIQKMIRVKGRGLTGGELILSTEEFDALKELAKEFEGNRNNEISKGVNTKDKMSTQSIIGIKPKGLNLELYRKESFGGPQRYKGYDESDTGGELVAQQSVIYQLADDKLAENNPNAPDKNIPSDVANLAKAQDAATVVASKAKNINTIQEFSGAFKNWFETLGFQPGKISKMAIKNEVDKILITLGYK
jgi:hypothetical protein